MRMIDRVSELELAGCVKSPREGTRRRYFAHGSNSGEEDETDCECERCSGHVKLSRTHWKKKA